MTSATLELQGMVMGDTYDSIDADLEAWLQRQKVFFVATAPLSPDGHINCSPKGGNR